MNMLTILYIVTLAFEGLLGLFSVYSAYSLFSWTPPSLAKSREALHYPRWYWMLAGVMAAIGAVGLLVGLVFPVLGAVATVWMIDYFIVAAFTHIFRNDLRNLVAPLVFLVCFAGLAALRWGDLAPLFMSK
ncbi:MAG: DoxX family protein [Ktedonobacterales bacterium]